MFDHFDQMTNDLEYLLKQEKVTNELVNTFVALFCSDTGSSKPKQQPTTIKTKKNTFKGKCDNCHQVGHKRVDCPLRSQNGQVDNGLKNNFKGRCNNCQQIGHKKVDCPQLRHMNVHVINGSGGSNQKNKSDGKNTHTPYNKRFVQQQEEKLRQISMAKQKEGKSGMGDGDEKEHNHKRSKRRSNQN